MALRRASNATAAADTKARSTPKLLLIHSPIARKRGFLADTSYGTSADMYPGYGAPYFLPNAYDSDADGVIDCIDDLTAALSAPWISSSFGWRTNDETGEREFHAGTDIDVPTGTPVRAAQRGVIQGMHGGFSENEGTTKNGNFARVNNDDGTQTVLIHLLSVNANLKVGDYVFPGDPIGSSNNTGNSRGSHLHAQIWRNQNWRSLSLDRNDRENYYDPEERYNANC